MATAPVRPPGSGRVVPYDFQQPSTLAREHARRLDTFLEAFARQWSSQLGARMRTQVSVTPAPASLVTYDAYTASLPATTSLVLLQLEGVEARGVLQLPLATVVDWVSRMLGSAGETGPVQRHLTATESGILRRTVRAAMADLAYAFTGVLEATPVPDETVHHGPRQAQAATPAAQMIVTPLGLTVGAQETVTATLALPASAILPRLGATHPVDEEQDAPRLAMEQLAATPVEVCLEMDPAPVSSLDVLRLDVGDLVPLNHPSTRPFTVTVGGTRLATAIPVVNGSRTYLRIIETELDT